MADLLESGEKDKENSEIVVTDAMLKAGHEELSFNYCEPMSDKSLEKVFLRMRILEP